MVVQRGGWKVEEQAVKRAAAMADSLVEWMVDRMVGQWAVGLGYDVVEKKDKQTATQRVEQWVEMMDQSMVDLKGVSMVAS